MSRGYRDEIKRKEGVRFEEVSTVGSYKGDELKVSRKLAET